MTDQRLAPWVWLFFLALAILTLLSLTRYMYRVQRLERVYRIVATQNAVLRATHDALAFRLTATPDPQELEQEIRERQGLVQPGEIPARVPPADQVEAPPRQAAGPSWQSLPPWQAWWLLFFGPEEGSP